MVAGIVVVIVMMNVMVVVVVVLVVPIVGVWPFSRRFLRRLQGIFEEFHLDENRLQPSVSLRRGCKRGGD